MNDMLDTSDRIFQWDSDIGQLLCLQCGTCIYVDPAGQIKLKHFQERIHKGVSVSKIKDATQGLHFQSTSCVSKKLRMQEPVAAVAGLPVFDAYRCQLCQDWYSMDLHKSRSHVSKCHPQDWSRCKTHLDSCRVQTLMRSTNHTFYFEVKETVVQEAADTMVDSQTAFDDDCDQTWKEIRAAQEIKQKYIQEQIDKTNYVPISMQSCFTAVKHEFSHS